MSIDKVTHKVKWFAYACAALPSYVWHISVEPLFSKEVRALKRGVRELQRSYVDQCKLAGTSCNHRLRVRHETYDGATKLGIMHDFIIEDRDFWLGTIRVVVDAVRITSSPKMTYTKSYLVQNMGDQFRECESVADALQKLDSIKLS